MALCGAVSSTSGPMLSNRAALELCALAFDDECALQVSPSTASGFASPFSSCSPLLLFLESLMVDLSYGGEL